MTSLEFQPSLFPERDVYTVSRLNREARILLERGLPPLWIEGEISNLSRPSSGHWYFSLKDANAQVRCAMFKTKNLLSRCNPCDGLHVLVRGRISLYEPRGEYQLIADHIEEAGEGELRRRFELLKAKLQREGLCAEERKRALPVLPRRIGVVTSPTGAAIRDILHILARRFPAIPVVIYPAQVQGFGSAEQIASAIRLASGRSECDVLIVARGGGSLEDLWSFNEERVARALAACAIPTVTGIGHEVDFTIADFVADRRAPTPSGAAEIVVPDCREIDDRFRLMGRRLTGAIERLLQQRGSTFTWLQGRLAQCHPGVRLRHQAQRLDDFEQRLKFALVRKLEACTARLNHQHVHLLRLSPRARLREAGHRMSHLQTRLQGVMRERLTEARVRAEVAARALNAVSPLATLDRGYAIVTRVADGKLIRAAGEVQSGDVIDARVHHGRLRAVVQDREE